MAKALVVSRADLCNPNSVRSQDGKWVMVHNHNDEIVMRGTTVHIGTAGEIAVVEGGSPPHRLGSTGRVVVSRNRITHEYFPAVAGCRWAQINEPALSKAREGVSA